MSPLKWTRSEGHLELHHPDCENAHARIMNFREYDEGWVTCIVFDCTADEFAYKIIDYQSEDEAKRDMTNLFGVK